MLRPAAALARRACWRTAPCQPQTRLPPLVGCSSWATRSYARPSLPAPPPFPSAGEADLFDDGAAEDDADFWLAGAEEVDEGVFVSEPAASAAAAGAAARDGRPRPPSSIKHLNRLLARHRAPDVPESDLEERFVKGRGPGGQAINKTNSCVCLTHVPTGIRVQAQPTRSREQNRAVARRILSERLDLLRARELGAAASGAPTRSGEAGEAGQTGAAGESAAGESAEGQGVSAAVPSRKERLAGEARTWSKQELRWEKARRRKSNRAKKVKKRDRREDEDDEKGGDGVEA